MSTCKTCKHWSKARWDGDRLGVRGCDATPMLFDSTQWTAEGDRREFLPTVTATAFAQDASDYSASLYTKPEHGCTMHEPREQEPRT